MDQFDGPSVDECANCYIYRWKQPSDKSSIKRCASCKYFYYCSLECQNEHWHKVHKYHCKYLAGKKKQKHIKHDPSLCRYCLEEANVGEKAMSSSKNSCLGCPWSNTAHSIGGFNSSVIMIYGSKAPSPFQLGEITGRYDSLIEHTLVILQRLHHKMFKIYRYWNKEFGSKLVIIRDLIRASYCFMPTQRSKNPHNLYRYDMILSLLIRQLYTRSLKAVQVDMTRLQLTDSLRLVDSCKLLISFLSYNFEPDETKYSLPEHHFKVSFEDNSNIWRKILSIMESGIWSYEMLVETVCSGITIRNCFSCRKKVSTVNYVIRIGIDPASSYAIHLEPGAIILAPLPALVFICGANRCVGEISKVLVPQISAVTPSYSDCDNCLRNVSKGHRCSNCLTKFYCGKACLNEDWDIHKQGCLQVERKERAEKQERLLRSEMFNDMIMYLSMIKNITL